MFSSRYEDETCLFGVHSSCLVLEMCCFRRVHIGKRKCNLLPRQSNDQVHIVKQGVLGLHLDSTSHKLKRPKKFSSRWTVLTRCEKTGQHTLHVCKTHSPDSSVKESYPVQTSWSIKSAHCLKSSQRMDIFKEEGFIIHMGRQVAYISCNSRSEVKGWMCAVLEAVTLGFEYHCRCDGNRALGVSGECMLVLSPECIALLCPLTGAPLRKWPYFLLTSCMVKDDVLHWTTHDSEAPYTAAINRHNVFTLYNVLCRYLSHTNPNVQVDITVSKPEPSSVKSPDSPVENKYTERHSTLPGLHSSQMSSSPPGLCANQLYLSQEACCEKLSYEMLTTTSSNHSNTCSNHSNHSDYSAGMSSAGSAYDSDIYECMENSDTNALTDSIYEDMSYGSPSTGGYMTSHSGGSMTSHMTSHSRPRTGRSTVEPARQLYINMNKSPASPTTALLDRQESGQRANYEYIDIDIQDPRHGPPSEPIPPQLPCRKGARNAPRSAPRDVTMATPRAPSTIPRGRLHVGIKSYQEQVKLEKEMLVNFSAAILDSNSSVSEGLSASQTSEVLSVSASHASSSEGLSGGGSAARTYMNSAV